MPSSSLLILVFIQHISFALTTYQAPQKSSYNSRPCQYPQETVKMTGPGSPCGACKFLRRKCGKGCVLAPYFSHEQGATHFAAIHKVFGASNASKLLTHLPVSDRCEAALTIAYEAEARLRDPIYGCVSHIFALQQQVVILQAQLASLKAQADQWLPHESASTHNITQYEKLCNTKISSADYEQDDQRHLSDQPSGMDTLLFDVDRGLPDYSAMQPMQYVEDVQSVAFDYYLDGA